MRKDVCITDDGDAAIASLFARRRPLVARVAAFHECGFFAVTFQPGDTRAGMVALEALAVCSLDSASLPRSRGASFLGKSGCLYVRYEPATFTAYAGQNMISFRLVDLSSTEVFTARAAE